MIKVGITGGIGSGKSTITNFFNLLGIPIYQSDIQAKQLQQSNKKIIDGLKKIFSPDIYLPNGQLNRQLMASIIFTNTDLRQQVNQLIHPIVRTDFRQWASTHTNTPYVVCEAAIMIESGSYADMDKIIVVDAPLQQRIERTMLRDKITRQQVENRIKSQMPTEALLPYANYIINTDDKHFVIPQLLTIDKELRNL